MSNRFSLRRFSSRLGILLCLISMAVSCTLERPPIRPKKNLTPDQPVYYDFIARKYYIQEEYEKAIYQYQKILDKFSDRVAEFNQDLAWAEYEIGYCYYRLGDNEKAIEHFERVILYYSQSTARILAQKMIGKIQGYN